MLGFPLILAPGLKILPHILEELSQWVTCMSAAAVSEMPTSTMSHALLLAWDLKSPSWCLGKGEQDRRHIKVCHPPAWLCCGAAAHLGQQGANRCHLLREADPLLLWLRQVRAALCPTGK